MDEFQKYRLKGVGSYMMVNGPVSVLDDILVNRPGPLLYMCNGSFPMKRSKHDYFMALYVDAHLQRVKKDSLTFMKEMKKTTKYAKDYEQEVDEMQSTAVRPEYLKKVSNVLSKSNIQTLFQNLIPFFSNQENIRRYVEQYVKTVDKAFFINSNIEAIKKKLEGTTNLEPSIFEAFISDLLREQKGLTGIDNDLSNNKTLLKRHSSIYEDLLNQVKETVDEFRDPLPEDPLQVDLKSIPPVILDSIEDAKKYALSINYNDDIDIDAAETNNIQNPARLVFGQPDFENIRIDYFHDPINEGKVYKVSNKNRKQQCSLLELQSNAYNGNIDNIIRQLNPSMFYNLLTDKRNYQEEYYFKTLVMYFFSLNEKNLEIFESDLQTYFHTHDVVNIDIQEYLSIDENDLFMTYKTRKCLLKKFQGNIIGSSPRVTVLYKYFLAAFIATDTDLLDREFKKLHDKFLGMVFQNKKFFVYSPNLNMGKKMSTEILIQNIKYINKYGVFVNLGVSYTNIGMRELTVPYQENYFSYLRNNMMTINNDNDITFLCTYFRNSYIRFLNESNYLNFEGNENENVHFLRKTYPNALFAKDTIFIQIFEIQYKVTNFQEYKTCDHVKKMIIGNQVYYEYVYSPKVIESLLRYKRSEVNRKGIGDGYGGFHEPILDGVSEDCYTSALFRFGAMGENQTATKVYKDFMTLDDFLENFMINIYDSFLYALEEEVDRDYFSLDRSSSSSEEDSVFDNFEGDESFDLNFNQQQQFTDVKLQEMPYDLDDLVFTRKDRQQTQHRQESAVFHQQRPDDLKLSDRLYTGNSNSTQKKSRSKQNREKVVSRESEIDSKAELTMNRTIQHLKERALTLQNKLQSAYDNLPENDEI